jgi:hypothetical protein
MAPVAAHTASNAAPTLLNRICKSGLIELSPDIFSKLTLMKILQQFFQSEARRSGARHEFGRQLAQLPSPLYLITLHLLMADECAGALLGLQDTPNFEFAIGPHHRVGVDRKIYRDLPHRGQLIARSQSPRRHSSRHLIDDLAIDRNTATEIQPELELPFGILFRLAHLEI